jgi:hypothetical protein
MHASRGESEKVLVFARFFRGGFDGLAAEVEVAAFLHFSSAEGIHRLEGQAGFLDELEEARIVLVTDGVPRAGEEILAVLVARRILCSAEEFADGFGFAEDFLHEAVSFSSCGFSPKRSM